MKVINKTIGSLKSMRDWKKIVWDEPTEYNVPISKKVQSSLHGFSANEYVWYSLNQNDYREYISEFERLSSRTINGNYRFILDDKLVFEEVFSKYTKVPENYAWINNGTVFGLHGNDISNENILFHLKNWKKTILKRNGSGGGEGTYLIEYISGQFIVNFDLVSEEQIIGIINQSCSALLCEYIEQGPFPNSLFPHSTNTLRIICAKKKNETKAHVIAAAQRIGCEASKPVDNVSQGGYTAEIDLQTGMLAEAYAIHGPKGNQLLPLINHPDTGAPIKGRIIPGWKYLVEQIETLTNSVPYLNYVAWDVLLTSEGYCIIEGNASSGYRIFQMNKGVKHTLLGDVLRSYGIFK